MTTGWTGGQYSVYRVLLAIWSSSLLASRLFAGDAPGVLTPLLIIASIGCFALALGWHDRMAAIVVLLFGTSTVAFIDGAPLLLPRADGVIATGLLALHVATPPHPFGAWSARDRPDPVGGWSFPSWMSHLVWTLLAIVYSIIDLERLSGIAFSAGAIDASGLAGIGLLFDLAFVIAIFRVEWRASAWLAMSIWKLAWLAAFGWPGGGSSLVLLHFLAADPSWLASRGGARSGDSRDIAADARARLFYDGDCGLCHRTVRILLSEEANADERLRLRFAPLGGDAFENLLARSPTLDRATLPDSIVLELEDGRVLTRAAAALEIADRLGGLWRAIGFLVSAGGLVPMRALDAAYDVVAENRKRLFARPKDSCPILPPNLRERFDL
jgi:predicted DCC family thiol-disulfide oxidoreductase YuxK